MVRPSTASTRRVHSIRRGPSRGVGEVGLGLRPRADGVTLRHGAEAETGDLREDEPHPVRLLPAAGQLGLDSAKNWILGPEEAL